MRDTPISPDHEYILVYAKRLDSVRLYGFARRESDFPFSDEKSRYRSTDLTVGMTREMRPNQFYALKNPTTGVEYWPPETRVWRFEPTTMRQHIEDGNVIWPDDNQGGRMSRPRFKTRFVSGEEKANPVSSWITTKSEGDNGNDSELTFLTAGLNQEATKELREILADQVLDYPKPVSLIRGLCAVAARGQDIIVDFFAGSGTTAQAVLDLNKQDGGNRKFILVQLPEPTSHQDYPTIADICKERVRRVAKKLDDADGGQLPLWPDQKQDHGFRVFKLAESNFKTWNADVPAGDVAGLAKQMEMFVEHIRKDRTSEDILYELLLKSGFPLTTPVEKLSPAGLSVYSAAGGALLICLERHLTMEVIRAMAELKPERVICLDRGFAGNDQLKANAVQIFRTKGVASFRTV